MLQRKSVVQCDSEWGKYLNHLEREKHHNKRLRVALAGAAGYGAIATIAAIVGWCR